jgi:predicted enzyme related to lactoylglutathione lyase
MTERPQTGRFVWHEINSPDPDASVAYYTSLLGYDTNRVEMGEGSFTALVVDGASVGGVVALKEGDDPHWASYCTVADLDAALARARSLGATVDREPRDVPGVGRWARIVDPQGARLYPFAWAGEAPPEPTGPPVQGTFCWHELLARDADAAARFYGEIFGWGTREFPTPNGPYTLLDRGNAEEAGIMLLPKDAAGPCQWLPYVAVESVDAVAGTAGSLGGTVFVPPTDIEGVGRFSVTADPQGAMICFYRRA